MGQRAEIIYPAVHHLRFSFNFIGIVYMGLWKKSMGRQKCALGERMKNFQEIEH